MLQSWYRRQSLLSIVVAICIVTTSEGFVRITSPRVTNNNCIVMQSTGQIPTSSTDRSRDSYRKITSAVALLLPMVAFSDTARAGFFMSAEQESINSIAIFQKPVYDLLEQLRAGKNQVLKGGPEDSNVVQQNVNIYIVPLQTKMSETSQRLQLSNPADQARIELLPLLMKGHILELTQAVKEGKAQAQFKEVEEVQETLVEYLKLASSKFTVAAFVPPRPFTDAEFFGPFGCEYWGKRRVEGTNKCEAINQ